MSESQMPPAARWSDGGADVPAGARALLAVARRPRVMTNEQRARSAARVALLAAVPAATVAGVGSKWAGGKILALFAGFGIVGVGLGLMLFMLGGPKSTVDDSHGVVRSTATATTTQIPTASAQLSTTPPPSSEKSAIVPPASATVAIKPSVSTASTASASATGDSLAREAALLEKARGLIAADPAGALAVCETHRKEFPAGQLSAEREVLAVDALKRLGRTSDARQRGEAFIAHNPKSFYVDRVRKLIEGL